MLDTRPKENESLSWLWVGLWTMLILATIPLARAIASRLEDSAGTAVFLWLTAGTIVAALLVALRALARRQLALGAYIGLTVFGGALLGVAWHLRGNPVEAFHLVQYGILSVLIYRALLHRCSDNSIYLLSAVLTGSVGILDEWIQWLIPERYWGFRDVVINFTAAVLAQGLLASGLRPKLIRGWPSGDSLRRLCFGVATFLGMLCLSFANTPDRIAWYAERIPGASFLLDSIDQAIFPEFVRIHEVPHLPRGLGSAPFDGDGVATRPKDLITEGTLRTYLLDAYSACRLGLETTGNAGGVRNLLVSPGGDGEGDLLAGVSDGFYVTEVMGQGVNLVTGDYSRGAAGYRIVDGRLDHPVEEVTIAGNLADMFMDIVAAGEDVDTRGNIHSGGLLIRRMMVAGL